MGLLIKLVIYILALPVSAVLIWMTSAAVPRWKWLNKDITLLGPKAKPPSAHEGYFNCPS
jgi:hypothetical protein